MGDFLLDYVCAIQRMWKECMTEEQKAAYQIMCETAWRFRATAKGLQEITGELLVRMDDLFELMDETKIGAVHEPVKEPQAGGED